MQDVHVPSLGLRSWAVFMIASVFGANLGDFVTGHLALGFTGRMLVLVAVLVAIFTAERYDRSKTQAWYWMAVVVIQAASTKLADFSTIELGFGRVAVIAGLAVLLVATFVVARSSPTLLISTHMISRPGRAAKPMADSAHWVAMVVASTLGSVAADAVTFGLGFGAPRASVILSALAAVAFCLHRLPQANRLLVYWLTVAAVRAVGNAVGDVLVRDPRLALGLPLSTALTGALMAAVLVLWREGRPSS